MPLFEAQALPIQLLGQQATVPAQHEAAPALIGSPVPVALPEAALLGTRRLAWGGDGKRGTARLSIAAGPLAGAEITVEVDGRDVEVRFEHVGEGPVEAWAARIQEQFGKRGLKLRRFEREQGTAGASRNRSAG